MQICSTRAASDCEWAFTQQQGKTIKIVVEYLNVSTGSFLDVGDSSLLHASRYKFGCRSNARAFLTYRTNFSNGGATFYVNNSAVNVKFHQDANGYPGNFTVKVSILNSTQCLLSFARQCLKFHPLARRQGDELSTVLRTSNLISRPPV